MAHDRALKISYCTTCKGRLHHLRETLPANLAAEKDNPNVEFVVLDYGDDGRRGDLGAWIRDNFPEEIKSGRLRYARHEAAEWKMAHAKNMAQRLATGDIVCNLDADNFIGKDFSRWMGKQFERNPHSVVTHFRVKHSDPWRQKLQRLVTGKPWECAAGSLGGVLAMRRSDFLQLRGYDEQFEAWGYEDWNLAKRARDAGLKVARPPRALRGDAIEHTDALRTENLSTENQRISEGYLGSIQASKAAPRTIARIAKDFVHQVKELHAPVTIRANPSGEVGCGEVRLNFDTQMQRITPLAKARGTVPPAMPEAAYTPQASLRSDWAVSLAQRAHPQTLAPDR